MTNETTEVQVVEKIQDAFAGIPQQQEMPLALVRGQPVLQMPQDLYIPPDALEVILESFEGPLDLLLYLIRRQNLDILDIPVAEITRQYMDYIEMMREVMRLELAAEYLLMAAILAEIKSRLLLPRPPAEEGVEEDPRAELVRRLQEYERFKKAAADIDELVANPRQARTEFRRRAREGAGACLSRPRLAPPRSFGRELAVDRRARLPPRSRLVTRAQRVAGRRRGRGARVRRPHPLRCGAQRARRARAVRRPDRDAA